MNGKNTEDAGNPCAQLVANSCDEDARKSVTRLCDRKYAPNSLLNSNLGSASDRLLALKDDVTKLVISATERLPKARPLPFEARWSAPEDGPPDVEGKRATYGDNDYTVCVRVRPLLPNEIEAEAYSVVSTVNPFALVHAVQTRWNGQIDVKVRAAEFKRELKSSELSMKFFFSAKTETFRTDVVFGGQHSNDEVYQSVAQPLLPLVLSNGIGTVLCYGQTGSGKTFTMTAIGQRIARDIFDMADRHRLDRGLPSNDSVITGNGFKLYVCFFELFGKKAFDLLADRKSISILEDSFGNAQIAGVLERLVTNPVDFLDVIRCGSTLRMSAKTAKNDYSSRTHAVCRVRVVNEALPEAEDGLLYLVDLAGSENNNDSAHHDRDRIAETREINTSLSVLKDCIRKRAQASAGSDAYVHVPYRTSRLTQMLKDNFEMDSTRQCRTVFIANVAPSILDVSATLNTLRYTAPLRVPVREHVQQVDAKDPSTWTNEQLREWVLKNYPQGKIDPNILCPTESGKQICRLPEGDFIARCLYCPDVTPLKAKDFYLRLWDLLVTARTRSRRRKLKYVPKLSTWDQRAQEIDPTDEGCVEQLRALKAVEKRAGHFARNSTRRPKPSAASSS